MSVSSSFRFAIFPGISTIIQHDDYLHNHNPSPGYVNV
jgi:hypothetical protein